MKLPPSLPLHLSKSNSEATDSVAKTPTTTASTTNTENTLKTAHAELVSTSHFYHNDPQELGSYPTPLTPASSTGKVPFHYQMAWTTTTQWLSQLTRKQTRWKPTH
jgi:hypothetical protein